MNTEPVLTLGGITLASLTVLAAAVIGLSRAFGWYNFTDTQEQAIVKFIVAAWAVGVPLGLAIRSVVYSPNTVETIKTTLAEQDAVPPDAAKALAK